MDEKRAGLFLADMSGRVRLTLLGILTCTLLVFGFLLLLQTPVQAGLTSLNGSNSCMTSGCHATPSTTGTIATAINGTTGTAVTVAAGGSFEVDWMFSVLGSKNSVGAELIIPSGWSAAAGTVNAPGLANWNSVWDVADGVASGWSQNCNATGDGYPNTLCYSINYANSVWDAGSRDTAYDNGSTTNPGDRDNVSNRMGTDTRITVPAGTAPGTYTVTVEGIGHDANSRTHVEQAITVTVPDTVAPTVNTFTMPATASSLTVNVTAFTASDNVAVTGYKITESATAPLPGDAGWTATAPTSFTFSGGGSKTAYAWAKDAAGLVSASRSATVTITVKTDQTITVTAPAPPSAAYNSQFTVAATASSGLSVSYSSGTPTVCTNSGATFTMVSGTGTCTVRYDQAGNATYNAAPQVTNSVTAAKINQSTAVGVSAPTSAYYGQTGLSVTASGGDGTGAYSYSAGSSTACTVNSSTGALNITSGTGTCNITATRAADVNYNISAASSPATVAINKATQATVTVSAPVGAYYGQTGLSATAAGGSGTGAYNYDAGTSTACTVNPSSGALTFTSGSGTCSITATRAADTNYSVSSVSAPATVAISKATPTVSVWPNASAITYGQTLAASTLSGGSATPAGTFAFTTPSTAPNAGIAAQGVTFTPTDTTNYNTATGSVNVTVNKADPSVTAWPTASAITYGQTLAASTLNGGSATPAGSFAFTTPTTVPNAGAASQSVTFTPTDTANYNNATSTVSVTVNKADPTVTTWPTASAITYGQTLASSTLSGGTASTGGSFAFTTPITAPDAGSASQSVTFTPTDTVNYNAATGSVSVTVNKADQTISFGALANKTYGDAAFTLSATGGASGNPVTFASSNTAVATISGTTVTIVGAGITTITASQAGNVNYNAASDAFQSLTVDKANQTITFASLTAKNVGDADFAPGAITNATGLTISYTSSDTAVATIVAGQIHIVGAGTTNITASQAGDTNYNAAADVVQPLTVAAGGTPTLEVIINGNGSVNSTPSGINCTGGTCSDSTHFSNGQQVQLDVLASWNYDFTGWTGPCTVNGTTCTVTVNNLTQVTATFTAKQLVKMPDGSYKPSIQEAYASATEGSTLKLRDQGFTENLDFNSTAPVLANVNIEGGYNADYTAVTGQTTITGTVTLTSGGVTVSNMIIQ